MWPDNPNSYIKILYYVSGIALEDYPENLVSE